MKSQVDAFRQAALGALVAGEDGERVCRHFAQSVERHLIDTLEGTFAQGHPAGIGVLAAGGLARACLAPRADLDLHILIHPTLPDPPARVEPLLYALWDAGLVLGHSVQTLEEMRARLADDPDFATSMLEARPLWGDPALIEAGLSLFWRDWLPQERSALFVKKRDELHQRRARFAGAVHLVEPNVKHSPGGLRDVESLLWLGLLRGASPAAERDAIEALAEHGELSPRALDELRAHRAQLLRIRAALHLVTGREEERLLFQEQESIAAMLGLSGVAGESASEALLRVYFRSARRVQRIVDDYLEALAGPGSSGEGGMPDLAPPASLEDGFCLRAGWLAHPDAAAFRTQPSRIVDAIRLSHELRVALAPETREAVYDALRHVPPLHEDAACAAALWRLMRSGDIRSSPFGELLDMGVLPALLRDVQRLEGRFKQDGYHAYTTDAHLCRCVDLALRAMSGAEPVPVPLHECWQRTSRGHLVVLGALMHDIGKGLPGDHAETGVQIALREARRMQLAPDDLDILTFLVRSHLSLSETSQRRDLSDPGVIESLAREVRTPERLDLLALLTWVDIASVAPGMFTDWKARLLGLAVERVRAYLLHPDASAFLRGEDEAEVRQRSRMLLAGHADADDIERFLAGASVRTLASRLADELIDDLVAFAAAGPAGSPLVTSALAEGGRAHVVRVVCRDRPGLLADLAAALSSHGANVLHANLDAREDGIVVDAFRIDDKKGGALSEHHLALCQQALAEAGAGGTRHSKTRGARRARRTGPALAARIRLVEESDAWGATIVELRGEDRPGLVADVARVFSDLGWNIVLAKINTEGRVVRDTFYVVRALRAERGAEGAALLASLERALLRALREGGA